MRFVTFLLIITVVLLALFYICDYCDTFILVVLTRIVSLWLLLFLSSDWRSYKLCQCMWVHGQWCKHYGSNMSIIVGAKTP